MVIFRTKSTIFKFGNGYGVRLPNHETMKLEENTKVIMEVTDDGKIILTPIKDSRRDNYTEDKFDRLRRYRLI